MGRINVFFISAWIQFSHEVRLENKMYSRSLTLKADLWLRRFLEEYLRITLSCGPGRIINVFCQSETETF